MWSLNETKGRFINGLRAWGEREVEIDDEESENMPEMAAMASGDPRIPRAGPTDPSEKAWPAAPRAINAGSSRSKARYARTNAICANCRSGSGSQATTLRFSTRLTLQTGSGKPLDRHRWRAIHEPVRRSCRGAVGHRLDQGGNPKAKFSIDIDGKPLTSLDAVSDAIRSGLSDASPLPLVMEDGTRFKRRRTHQGRLRTLRTRSPSPTTIRCASEPTACR